MNFIRDVLSSPGIDSALVTLGKIVVAFLAFTSILRGIINIGEVLFYFYRGMGPQADIVVSTTISGSIDIVLGYAYCMLLDMGKKGKLVSLARFFANLFGGILIALVFPVAFIGGLATTISNIIFGIMITIGSIIVVSAGFGVSRFIEERDNFQSLEKKPKYSFWYGSKQKLS